MVLSLNLVLKSILTCGCFYFAIYITIVQFEKYFRNEDSSSVKIKSYIMETKNRYPDISICFCGPSRICDGTLSCEDTKFFNKSRLPFNFTTLEMIDIMRGKMEGHSSTLTEIGAKFLLELSIRGNQDLYERLVLDHFTDIFDDNWVTSSDSKGNEHRALKNRALFNKDRFLTTWLDATTFCITKRLYTTPSEVIERQNIFLKMKNIQQFDEIFVYIHHPDQLIKRVGSTVRSRMTTAHSLRYRPLESYDEKKNLGYISINNVKVLKKRNKSNDPCDETEQSEDEIWIKHAIEKVGCVPIFWANKISDRMGYDLCNNYEEYAKVQSLAHNYWNVAKDYSPPCSQMSVLSYYKIESANESGIRSYFTDQLDARELLYLKINYNINEYEEVINERLFNEWDLFSQVGGIIGITLGFSFLQAPELIRNMAALSESILTKYSIGICKTQV